MKKNVKIPFKGLSEKKRVNLLLIALATYFVISFAMPLVQGDRCRAIDFCGYYGAGLTMNNGKISDIYNSQILGQFQSNFFSSIGASAQYTEVISMVYLPVFLVPLKFFALFSYPISLLIWYLINIFGLIFYLYYFYRQISGGKPDLKILALLLLSYPVLLTFNYGQLNILLVICIGEFLRSLKVHKPLRAGIWLGGWLLKPQLLILILPYLLIQKKYKALFGFIISSIILFGTSFLLVGWDGMSSLFNLIFESAGGGAASHYEYMMNWRMLSYYVSIFTTPTIGWIFLGVASLATAAVPLIMFRRKRDVDTPEFWVGLLGVLAATTLVAYHAHLHTAMILIPILIYLYAKQWLSPRSIILWIVIPYLGLLLLYLIGLLILGNILPTGFGYIIEIGFGSATLITNLILLFWSLSHSTGIQALSGEE